MEIKYVHVVRVNMATMAGLRAYRKAIADGYTITGRVGNEYELVRNATAHASEVTI